MLPQITTLFKSKFLARLFIIVVIVLIPLDLFFLYSFTYLGRVYPNISINQYEIGGKDRDEIAQLLLQDLENRQEILTLIAEGENYVLNEAEAEVVFDIDQTIEDAYNIGREVSFWQNLTTRLKLIRAPQQIPLSIIVSEPNLDHYLASISAQLNEPMIPPTIEIIEAEDGKIASVSAGQEGKSLDVNKAKNEITQAFATQSLETVVLVFNVDAKPVTQKQIDQTKDMANKLIGKNLVLNHDDQNWELTDEELINFLSFYNSFDQDKIASWSGQLAETIDHPPENALFEFDGQRVTEFKPAKDGLVLDQTQATQAIQDGIKTLADQDETSYDIALVVQAQEPEIKTGEVNDLGIKELIGKGESWFSHSIPGRIHNLTLAASKFHGVLIPPGETFSFNQTVDEIDQAHGYKQAYIIKEGRTVLGDGGGVCQVSTTMFRSILDAGLDIVDRRAHAYRVSYYEQNYEVGVDATVFSPSVDLKFKNDTPGHILVQTYTNPSNYYMRFELFGTSDGRQVEISKSRMWDQSPPPPDMHQDDPSLPAGVVKQIDWAAWGARVSFDWKVTKNNEVLHEKTFYSNYKPWQAIYLKGTGGN